MDRVVLPWPVRIVGVFPVVPFHLALRFPLRFPLCFRVFFLGFLLLPDRLAVRTGLRRSVVVRLRGGWNSASETGNQEKRRQSFHKIRVMIPRPFYSTLQSRRAGCLTPNRD